VSDSRCSTGASIILYSTSVPIASLTDEGQSSASAALFLAVILSVCHNRGFSVYLKNSLVMYLVT